VLPASAVLASALTVVAALVLAAVTTFVLPFVAFSLVRSAALLMWSAAPVWTLVGTAASAGCLPSDRPSPGDRWPLALGPVAGVAWSFC